MIVADKWLVLEDGCVMNVDTGMILWSSKTFKGQPCFKLVDDKGKIHFFLKKDLMDMASEEEVVKKAYAAKSDLEEWGEFLPIERMSHTPKIVDEFHQILEIEKIKAQTELEYAIKSEKPKEVKLERKSKRDNIKTIMDFVNQ
jgi:hypothetical protein